MISDSELANRIHEILRSCDLETITTVGVRRRLEEEFTVYLNDRMTFIREQIDHYYLNDDELEEGEVDQNAQNDAVEEDLGLGQGENVGEDETAQEEVSDEERNKSMISDSELVNRLHEILPDCDLETTTNADVRHRLEDELSVDLYERRNFIMDQIDLFVQMTEADKKDAARAQEDDENPQHDGTAVEEEQQEAQVGHGNWSKRLRRRR